MKTLKYILLGIAGIIALILIVAAFTQKTYSIQRDITIHKPAKDVYDYIRIQRNQLQWSAWYKMDTTAKIEFRGTDGEVGAVWAWNSEITGKGEETIKELEPEKMIASELHFIKPFEGKASNTTIFQALDSNQTLVRNTFSSSSPYPMNIMLLFVDMEKMIGTPIQDGLNAIKANVEK